MLLDLRRVAAAKFLPAGGIVAKPFPQRGAGRYVLGPLIDGGVHLPDAARPQPIDQYPSTIRCIGGFVRSFQFDVGRRESLTHRHRSEIMEATGLSPPAPPTPITQEALHVLPLWRLLSRSRPPREGLRDRGE